MSEQLAPLTGRLGLASPRGKVNVIAISALLVTGLLGIPGLYLAGMIGIETVLTADEVLLTNSSWGVLPVVGLEQEAIASGTPGPVANALRAWWLEQ